MSLANARLGEGEFKLHSAHVQLQGEDCRWITSCSEEEIEAGLAWRKIWEVWKEGEKQDVGGRGDEQVRGSRIEEPCDEAPLPIPPPLWLLFQLLR